MNSHFSGLQNRDRIHESKKKTRREKLETRKTSLTQLNYDKDNTENIFQTVSDTELKKIKSEIRKKTESQNKKYNYRYGTMFIIVIAILIFFALKYNVF